MKKLKKIFLVLLALFVAVTAIGFLLPRRVHVERSMSVNAAPGAIYPLVANFKDGWSQWNPFQEDMKPEELAYAGPSEGVGATQSWDTKDQGDGKMTITKADPARGIEYDLLL